MLELKVQCVCGQKYKFDVEPVNNRMPFTVKCPICGVDGTERANGLLQERAAAQAATPASASPYPSAPAPMDPAVYGAAAALEPPKSEQPRLRINLGTSHAAPSAAPVESPSKGSPVDAAIAAAGGKPLSRFPGGSAASAPANSYKEPDAVNLPLGIMGAVVGGFLGMMGWYLLIKTTHYEIGYAAWGVGVLAGFGARILGRGGDATLGIVAGICALVGILGGQYLFAVNLVQGIQNSVGDMMTEMGGSMYDTKVELGHEALKAQTDEDFKALYEKINFGQPTEAELVKFKEKEVPELKDIANGKITKAQFLKSLKAKTDEPMEKLTFTAKWELFKSTVDGFTILFIFLGVSSAYKIGARG